MVVCPQCQFENPNLNKFCQSCGTSLTQKYCPECAATVPLNTLECHNCGTVTGTVYLAVVSPSSLVAAQPDQLESLNNDHLEGANTVEEAISDRIETEPLTPETPQESDPTPAAIEPEEEIFSQADIEAITIAPQDALSPSGEPSSQDMESLELPIGAYLDPQQRYQLLEPLPPLQSGETLTVKVLDTQPLQVSPLKALEKQDSTPSDKQLQTFIITAAQPYFSLASEHSNYFPRLQDAWEQPFYSVIILEDFTNFPLLSDLWSNKKNTAKQIVYWLEDLVKLWVLLEPWNCRQSLLEIQNLRFFSEDSQQLCLKQLYFESPNSALSLSDLGLLWQELFEQSQRTYVGSLKEKLRDLIEGKIQTVEQLQKDLMVVLDEINFPSTSTPQPIDRTATPPSSLNQAPTVIPAQKLKSLEAVGRTDIGRQRDHNEDCFGMETQIKIQETPQGQTSSVRGLYILCDGMGGHAGGEVASQMAVDTLKDYFQNQYPHGLPTAEILQDAILQANEAIYTENQQGVRSGVGRMGTTLVMALVVGHQVAVAHVGDSRLYRLTRTHGLQQVTVDHEVGQREIQKGIDPELAYSRPDAYQLTQALGPREEQFVHPEVQFLEIEEDTVLIIASDGLTDNNLLEIFCETQLEPLLKPETPLSTAVDSLIALANQHNGHDNITAIVVRAWV
ncbi:Serine/threonine phosphatase stp [Planktothrix agardhii]|jgi:protein phosphatase|uniref:serine/threonine phosphatase n=1 Tax=Planktothrix agardhii TaxID=1160 RepID=UPI001F3FCDC4|nr:serine/threonine phosphatase [Planktothrix agardhii]MCF3574556.1 serine/threonine phosphatase [Planktothrix agardhii 1812]MCF3581579.1 serine/threonine phosphatase [Planktothrix agardhii 1811]MCF3626265.1 serine/threonine phosphatase [Planktothrix agardhii 1801]CAD5938567.1 Serine/threonine phosphatase stp [Planktothrix agardhii]